MSATVYTEADVAAALDLDLGEDEVIASQRAAFEALGRGDARIAPKAALPNPSGSDLALSYLSRLSPSHGVVSKLVALHPDNAEPGCPRSRRPCWCSTRRPVSTSRPSRRRS